MGKKHTNLYGIKMIIHENLQLQLRLDNYVGASDDLLSAKQLVLDTNVPENPFQRRSCLPINLWELPWEAQKKKKEEEEKKKAEEVQKEAAKGGPQLFLSSM